MTRNNIYKMTIFGMLLSLCASCHDDTSCPDQENILKGENHIVLEGSEQNYSLFSLFEGEQAPVFSVEQGDFACLLADGDLYFEQNDEGRERSAVISVTLSNGTKEKLFFSQKPATRSTTMNNFMRHHAVGYSYNALRGEYCNLNDLRCQVINREVLRRVQRFVDDNLYNEYTFDKYYSNQYTATSIEDYVHQNYFKVHGEGQFLNFNGNLSETMRFFQEGKNETYICHDERSVPKVKFTIESNVKDYIDDYPNLLTCSFRTAVERLKSTEINDRKAVADFVDTYGTHVVTDVYLGGKLSIDIAVEIKKFNLIIKQGTVGTISIVDIWNQHKESSDKDKDYEVLKDCKCRIDVLGGDLSLLNDMIGKATFGDIGADFSTKAIDDWCESVKYEPDSLRSSNVELTDMDILPIWDFISDETVSNRVRAYIESDAALMQQLLGNRNFINTSFPAQVKDLKCMIGNDRTIVGLSHVTNVISSNRYVATICYEWVPDIDPNNKVWVAYPIYEGYVKLGNGLCLHNDSAYSVAWMNHQFVVKNLGEHKGDTIYMNMGALGTQKYQNLEYQQSHLVWGVERPGGITIDGLPTKNVSKVEKFFGHFYAEVPSDNAGMPGWKYIKTDDDYPEEWNDCKQYVDNDYWLKRMRMLRDDDYIYIWNPTEINYIDE